VQRVLQVLRDEQYLPRGASSLPMAHKHVELAFDAMLKRADEALYEAKRSGSGLQFVA